MNGLTKQKVRSLFGISGFPILAMWELANQYWPRPALEQGREHEWIHYAKLRDDSPWWLVKTPYGLIELGARKQVIEINWSDVAFEASDLTDDVTTKEPYMVHAWTELKAAEYLSILFNRITTQPPVVL